MKRVFLLASLFLALPFSASAASLYISPATLTLTPGQTGTFTVYTESTGQAMNAATASVTIDAGVVMGGPSKTGSIISFWASEPTISGRVLSFEGVAVNPGYSGPAGKIISFTVRASEAGTYSARFLSGAVLANDGLGTDITSGTRGATLTVTEGVTPPPVTETGGGKLSAPVVTSTDFPSQESWYKKTSGTFSWELPPDVTAVRTLLDQSKTATPSILLDGRVSSRLVSDIPDGVNYLHVQFKNAGGWGDIAHVAIKVDTVAPVLTALNAVERDDLTEPSLRMKPEAKDALSGLAGYEASIDGGAYVLLKKADGYAVTPALLPGAHQVLVRALDNAGNVSPARDASIVVKPLESPHILSWSKDVPEDGAFEVSGTSVVTGGVVHLVLTRNGVDAEIGTATVAEDGTFSLLTTLKLEPGTYQLSGYVEDARGARSLPSQAGTVRIASAGFMRITLFVMEIIGLIIAIFAAILGALWFFFFLAKRTVKKHRELMMEIHETDALARKAFGLLRKDLAGYAAYLKRQRRKRDLTTEETDFIEEFETNLKESERLLLEDIKDIEKAAKEVEEGK